MARIFFAAMVLGMAAGCSVMWTPGGYVVGGIAGGDSTANPSARANRSATTGNTVTFPSGE